MNIRTQHRLPVRPLLAGCLALGAAIAVAACGSSSPGSTAGSAGSSPASTSSAAAVTISAMSVPA